MTVNRLLVSIVDDDDSVRESLPDLVQQFGLATAAFSSADAFLASEALRDTRCLILDVAMPNMSGPELLEELRHRRLDTPVIFITARGDESVRRELLAKGAVASSSRSARGLCGRRSTRLA